MTAFRRLLVPAAAAAILAASSLPDAAEAQEKEIQLPSTLAWTAYDVGSTGYNQAVAISNALKNNLNVSLRVLPGKNDISRMVPLREDRVPFSAMGIATYFAQEGVFEFAAPDWGPQPVRALLASNAEFNQSIGTAADANIGTLQDLKGKRVAYVVGAPAINHNIAALLAFAGLTWDDVERVEFGGYGASIDGVINNQADAVWASTTAGPAYQLESSPRGIHWPPVPHEDQEGWALDRQVWEWVVPFHEGAVRYFEEIGAWDEEKQAHNDRLIERQQVLQQAWQEITSQTDAQGEEFQQQRMEARAEALKQAVFKPIWTG